MRLVELFIIETTEEDRAIISLSTAIYKYIQKYAEEEHEYDNPDDEEAEIIRVGKIGQIFDTPLELLRDVNIQLMPDEAIARRAAKERKDPDVIRDPTTNQIMGIWYNDKTMVLNSDYIQSNEIKSIISHELRHALDDFKSDFKANNSNRYSTPKNKSFRKAISDPYLGNMKYLAEPAEINARFVEVLHNMVPVIRRAMNLTDQARARPYIMNQLKAELEKNRISELFPEKEKSSDYKRLMKRAMDFIEKEIAHVQQTK